jgi:hypothetical protein
LIVKPEGKKPLVKSKGRIENNIKIDLKERRSKFVDWIHLPQVKHQRQAAVKVLIKPSDSIKCAEFLD